MASLDPKLHEETISIHKEHEVLLGQLDQLDAAVEQMACYAEIFTDLATANQAMSQRQVGSGVAYPSTMRMKRRRSWKPSRG